MTAENQLASECCNAPLGDGERFCPKCGWECRVKSMDGTLQYVCPVPDEPSLSRFKCTVCGYAFDLPSVKTT